MFLSGEGENTAPESINLSFPKDGASEATITVLYPAWLPVESLWDKERHCMNVKLPCAPAALLFNVEFAFRSNRAYSVVRNSLNSIIHLDRRPRKKGIAVHVSRYARVLDLSTHNA